MVGKDNGNRHSRRGSRRAHREPAEVATQVAQVAVVNDVSEEPNNCLQLDIAASLPEVWDRAKTPAGGELLELGNMLPTIEEEKRLMTDSNNKNTSELASSPTNKSPAHLILKLPTPSRNSPRSKDLLGDGTPKSQGGTPIGRFGVISASPTAQSGIVRGPEPWGLPDSAASPQSSQKSGYRERLQARGQQAMQCSLMSGIASRSPTVASTTVTTMAPTQALPPSPGPTPLGTNVGVPNIFGGLPTPPSNLRPPLTQTTPWSVPNDFQMPQWFGSATMDMQALLNQQASMLSNCGQTTPFMLDSNSNSNQQLQMTPISCQQLPETPASSQNTTKAFGSWCQEELMATLMPQALSLDKEEIAERLRAAAPCCYDD